MKHLHKYLSSLALASLAFTPMVALAATPQHADYVAHINPVNMGVADNSAHGVAHFSINDDTLHVTIDIQGATPDMVHWQHFHGFDDSLKAATCPLGSDADSNGDGIVDLIETEPYSGTTMVPFISDPTSMNVAEGDYPSADADGSYHYEQTVSVSRLEKAFQKAFPGQELNLDKRVLYIHGVPESSQLADSVASLGPIPSQVTLPVACGAIRAGH